MRTLDEWLELQNSVHPKSIDLGLARVSKVARALGVDKAGYPVITVAGTNGKGSVVAHCEALLQAMEIRTGVFTSPHLVRYNERIRIGGAEVEDAALVDAFDRIEAARGDTTLTYFEFSALAALLLFKDAKVGAAVLEVGLGGRLDAVNLLDADVGVVTSIGLDHRDWLGDSLDAIGREKAGIFRSGRPAVLGAKEMPASVFEVITTLGARPVVAEKDFGWTVQPDSWSYRGPFIAMDALPPSALSGSIQYRNASTAIAAVEALGFAQQLTREVMTSALRNVKLSGRFHSVPGAVEWILDVAHNEPAARVFADHLAATRPSGKTYAVVGILGDKDSEAVARLIEPYVDHWIVSTIHEPRGLPAQALAARMKLTGPSVELAQSADEGFARAKALARPGDRVIVFGGFNIVGSALRSLSVD